jgi:hypothetical protein
MHSPRTACRHTVSGTISLPSPGCFSPFPHGTCSLSVAGKCLALRDGPRRFGQGFTCPVLLRCRACGVRFSRTGLSPSMAGLSRPVLLTLLPLDARSYNPADPKTNGLGSSRFARHYSGNRIFFLLSCYLDVSVRKLLSLTLIGWGKGDGRLIPPGCPIRKSPD